jgi:hypothetical protein
VARQVVDQVHRRELDRFHSSEEETIQFTKHHVMVVLVFIKGQKNRQEINSFIFALVFLKTVDNHGCKQTVESCDVPFVSAISGCKVPLRSLRNQDRNGIEFSF